ncbi:AAA family ATPase [Helicobacter sp. L8]|uniref:AAA family ATPase n=1 Tax=Helicobacter sp. L8 TaxID=2316078 RepID=UPI001F098665|nr:AAA family ATPase [Helicobacter sp. L8]
MHYIIYGILIWIGLEFAGVILGLILMVLGKSFFFVLEKILDIWLFLSPTREQNTSKDAEIKLIEGRINGIDHNKADKKDIKYKGGCVAKSKKPMGFYELKRHLLIQRVGCLAWIADHAYKNFGWVALKPLHQAQSARIKLDTLIEDQDRYILEGAEELEWLQKYPYRAYYFFGEICQQRQATQQEITFKNSAEVLDFLLNLYKPYAHFDPKFSQHQTMVNLNLEVEKEKNRAQFLYEKTLQSWSYSFESALNKICLKTPTQVKIPLQSLPFCPKTLTPVLEKYRWGDAYIFQTTYTPPPNLPKFDPEILRAHLSKSLKLWQEHLEECMQNLVPPQRKPKFKRNVRKQLAKLCLQQHCGLITPELIEHYKLSDPEDPEVIKAVAQVYIAQNFPSCKDKITIPQESEFFALRRFTLDNQKCYYLEQALWVWAWQRLLEIFNGSLEMRAIQDQLLARLSPEQALDFQKAFLDNDSEQSHIPEWGLIAHLNLPLAVFQHNEKILITKNPAFHPKDFLRPTPLDNDFSRLLFFYGRVLDEENIADFLHKIPPYAPKNLGVHALKIYLLQHQAGHLCEFVDQAYNNFGWARLNAAQQSVAVVLADIADKQLEQGEEVHYFFSGVCQERQDKQRSINFINAKQVCDFLIKLFKPYALQDPNHALHLRATHDTMKHVYVVDAEHFDARLYEEILKEWELDFTDRLKKNLQIAPDCAKISLKAMPFLPKEAALALELYAQEDAYVFQTTYTPPKDLPPFDRQILRANLKEYLRIDQGALAGVVDSLVRPKNKPQLKRKTRKQIAKLRLQETCGILAPKDFKTFHLDRPKAHSVLHRHRFYYQGQEHYYFEYALNIWVLQRLLEIFNGSMAMQAIEHDLLGRLSHTQALEFSKVFSQKHAGIDGTINALASHLSLPVMLESGGVVVPNPNFKAHVYLSHSPHNLESLRLLLDFKEHHKEPREPTLPLSFVLVSKELEETFSQLCAKKVDVYAEGLFFDDKSAFAQRILEMQCQFLKEHTNFEENYLEWCLAYVESVGVLEDKRALIQKIAEAQQRFTNEQATLERAFIEWWVENVDAELEGLFFDDKFAFFQTFLAMQAQFFKQTLPTPQEPKITTPPQESPPKTPKQPQPQASQPQDKYSPKAIKAYLDQFVIGQENAKKQMSLVFSDHYKRINGQSSLEKANAICIGPSGSGKTFLIEMATKYLDIPYCIANAAAFTPTGYLGNETNQMFATLYSNAEKDIEKAQRGVLVLDEIDKLGQGSWHDREWRQGVQNELLKVIEKGIVTFEYGGRASGQTITLQTDHMLFIVLGHFEKLWKNNKSHQKIPKFSNEGLIECGMKREFLRRFSIKVVFEPVDIDMLTKLLDRRLKPFQEEFAQAGSALEFSQEAKRVLIEEALQGGIGMSGLDQKLHEVLMPLRFDIECYRGFKCLITRDTLRGGCVQMVGLEGEL